MNKSKSHTAVQLTVEGKKRDGVGGVGVVVVGVVVVGVAAVLSIFYVLMILC